MEQNWASRSCLTKLLKHTKQPSVVNQIQIFADPVWPRLTQDDPGWPSLTQSDPDCPRLAQAFPSWPKLTPANPGFPKLTQADRGWPSLTQAGSGWPRLTQADPSWPRLTQVGPGWPSLTQADPGWPRLTHRLTPLPNLLSVPAELQPLQQGAVGSYGGNQVLKLDLQGDPLRCSDSQHAQILEQRRQKNDCPSFYYLYCSSMINFALTLLVRDIYKIFIFNCDFKSFSCC